MGTSCSKKSETVPPSVTPQSQPSDFYLACQKGDVQTVINLLTNLTTTEINRIEPNGSTALHAASYYGHAKIVELLLKRGCVTIIRNKFDKTPMDEAANEEIYQLFIKQQTVTETEDDSPPKSDRLEIYPNLNNEDKSNLATRIAKIRLMTYRTHKYQIEATDNTAQLERIFKNHVTNNDTEAEEAMLVLENFRETRNTDHLVELYLMETFIYRPPMIDNTFLLEMYVNLMKFNAKPYEGILYSGYQLTDEHLKPYRWSLQRQNSLLETRHVLSLTLERRVAAHFARCNWDKNEDNRISVIFEYRFHSPCHTVMNLKRRKNYLRSLHIFEDEQEAMILPGTFFEVVGISEDQEGFTLVRMVNIPVEREVLRCEIEALN